MRMLKMRKKTISLIVVLTFLMTLFPLALPAFAADVERLGAVVSVSDGKVVELNRVRVEFEKGELKDNASVIIGLPNGFKFRSGLAGAAADTEQLIADWTNGNGPNKISMVYDPAGDNISLNVVKVSDNEIKLTVLGDAGTTGTQALDTDKKIILLIDLGAVFVKEDWEGDIPLTFDAASGGFDEGFIEVGRVGEGQVTVSVVDDENFGDNGGNVVLRIREDRAGALKADAKSLKITLPKGFHWSAPANNTQIQAASTYDHDGDNATPEITSPAWLVDGVHGEVAGYKINIDQDEMLLNVNAKTVTKAAYIEIRAGIKVEDSTRADTGDIVATVSGDSKVTPSEIVVGRYGDFTVEVTAGDPTTVYAGQVEQKIADIFLQEDVAKSLVAGRSVTLTLPDWAKWGSLKGAYDHKKVELKDLTFPGKDGRVAKFTVNGASSSAAKIKLDKLEVVLSPEAPEGDLEVEVAGSAGVRGTVKVAEVKKPLEMTVDSYPVIIIGKADQAIGEITITEAKAGLLKKDKDLVISLPKDVDWDDWEVEVTEGDLEISRVKETNNKLNIRIKDDSREASTIKVTGSATAFRTVPEGRVVAEIGGDAIVVVNDTTEVSKYYTPVGTTSWNIAGKEAIKYDTEGLFPKETSVAEGQVATVGTPAPGEQKITAVFKLGSTDWTLNDVAQTMDVAPYAKDGRTYLPMRYVAKALGIPDTGILWKAGTATFISADRVVSVTIGSNVMTINGAPVPIDAAPEITNGRTMLPIRWVATAFGINVDWNAETQEVTVY